MVAEVAVIVTVSNAARARKPARQGAAPSSSTESPRPVHPAFPPGFGSSQGSWRRGGNSGNSSATSPTTAPRCRPRPRPACSPSTGTSTPRKSWLGLPVSALPTSHPSCGWARIHPFPACPSSLVVAPMYSAWPVNQNDWAADIEGGAPAHVEHEAVARPRRAALGETAAGVDEGGQVRVEEHEPRHVHESRAPGSHLKTSASPSKFMPPIRATSRTGPPPTVRFASLPKLRVGYHSP